MAQLSSDDDSSIFSPLWHLAGHLGQYFDSATKWPVYWMSMVRQGIAWSSKLPDHGDDAYYKLCQTFDEEKGVKDGVWHGPMGADCVTYFSHAKVNRYLPRTNSSIPVSFITILRRSISLSSTCMHSRAHSLGATVRASRMIGRGSMCVVVCSPRLSTPPTA